MFAIKIAGMASRQSHNKNFYYLVVNAFLVSKSKTDSSVQDEGQRKVFAIKIASRHGITAKSHKQLKLIMNNNIQGGPYIINTTT